MARIPTPIPESVGRGIRSIFMGPVLEVAWRLLVVALLLAVAYLLVVGFGGFGAAFVAGAILSALLSENIREAVSDVWNRNFWVWRV